MSVNFDDKRSMDENVQFLPELAFLALRFFFIYFILVSWIFRRSSVLHWSWNLTQERFGNIAEVMEDGIHPGEAGDIASFLNYQHFLESMQTNIRMENWHLIDIQLIVCFIVEFIAFMRIVAPVSFARDFIICLFMVYLHVR